MCLDHKSQQITITWKSFFNRTWISFFNSFSWALAVPCNNLRPTGPTLLPGPTKRLGWLGWLGWLGSWTPTWTAFSELELDLPLNCPWLWNCFSLFCWSPSCCCLTLLTVLFCKCGLWGLAYSVPVWTAKRLLTVPVGMQLLIHYRRNANLQWVSYLRWRWVTLEMCLCLVTSKHVTIMLQTFYLTNQCIQTFNRNHNHGSAKYYKSLTKNLISATNSLLKIFAVMKSCCSFSASEILTNFTNAINWWWGTRQRSG
jgi:hypothetical protein